MQVRRMLDLDLLDFSKGSGVVTVVTLDAISGAVLMVAHADREALERSLATGQMHYRSRTRGLWHKGATSGNVQHVVSLTADCDHDAVLARVRPAGPACHSGARTCFGEAVLGGALAALDQTIAQRSAAASGGPPPNSESTPAAVAPHHQSASLDPESTRPSYTQRLLADRNLRLKKLTEEAGELAVACADGDRARATEEAADLFYHTLVALRALGLSLDDVARTLDERSGR